MKNHYTLLIALLISFSLNAQIIDFPDANFKNALVNTNCVDTDNDNISDADADTNNDGEISVAEAEAIETLTVSNQNIASLDGIQSFINLRQLVAENNQLTSLDIGTLNELEWLVIKDNLFTATDNIIFPTNPINNWFGLHIENNLLTSITNLPSNLTGLHCSDNLFSSLDVSAYDLYEFELNNTPNLTSLVLSSYSDEIRLNNIGLTELDITDLTGLHWFDCRNNPNLTHLEIGRGGQGDGSGCYNISDNPVLETISFKNGFTNLNGYDFGCFSICNNPNLTFVCADEFEIENYTYEIWEGEWVTVVADGIQQIVDDCGYTNVAVSSYCSFEPGGDFYTIEGNTRLDIDTNGCDTNDSVIPSLNFIITNGSETGNFITNSTGNHSILVGDGSHTITPVLENSSYFTVTPSSLTVDFPTDASPFTQDFCLVPNETFNDLEITIIPVEAARPGFDTDYKLIYKNKGTTTLSGSVDLTFQDDLMDFVSATPTEDSQAANLLTWTFTDLTPFESREIDITVNLNSPMDTPPLNDDDVLAFTTSISSSETDETPEDNTFTLNQTVVNSFDPNDKTCLEGDFITPEMVGDYVHYMIRFENTGTADAINIVVKDDIDTSKYDLSSLVPLHASHNYVARIKDNATEHYVEFIFENINLPFDDANNDGYIVFKIKTLDTLVLNDTFENDAEIYFDFNFPIITNNEQTTVGTLSTQDFEFDNSISLYPNPTTDVLTLESQQAIKQVTIYDMSGRLINEIAIIGFKTEIMFSTEELSAGTYFVKIKTETGEIVKKVIKE